VQSVMAPSAKPDHIERFAIVPVMSVNAVVAADLARQLLQLAVAHRVSDSGVGLVAFGIVGPPF